MTIDLVRFPLLLLVAALLTAVAHAPAVAQQADANQSLVFISAFAAGDKGGIHAYQLNLETGRLAESGKTSEVRRPFFMALSPDRKHLYSTHAPGEFGGELAEFVSAFEIVGRGGQLKLLNQQSAGGSAACYLDVDATGKTVLVANYSSGSVASLPVRDNGSLGEASSLWQHEGSSVVPARQKGPHAHCIVVSPDNRFAYAADLGLDQVLGYRLNSSTAELAPNRQPFARTRPAAGPRHLTFHPNGKYLYVINELENSISLFDYDSQSGVLVERTTISTLPEDFEGTSHCADLKISPDGRFLFGTNRGHDSIAAFRIGEGGRLTLLGIQPSLGKGPQNLAITAGGALLLCANMAGDNVVVFRIDAETGQLQSVGDPLSMPSPSCILLLDGKR